MPSVTGEAGGLRTASTAGRLVVAATVAGSGVAMITGTVVNVALPDIAEALGAGTIGVQWILNSYLLLLASLILLGGALGDRFGRRRVYLLGMAVFALASVLSAAAPTLGVLLGARALMGVGGALLTPGSLAILEASFHPDDRSAAIGAWSGLGGVAAAIGPLLGGALLDLFGWRMLFLVNLPVIVLAAALTRAHVPESIDPDARRHPLDVIGTVTGAIGLSGVSYGLIDLGSGVSSVGIAALVLGAAALVAFVLLQRRTAAPLVPPSMFADRTFSVANALTFLVYAALGGVFFLLVVVLRQVLGYSGLLAGAATLPMTVMMLLLSARAGRLAERIGPRIPLTIGPLLLAAGMVLYARIDADADYLTGVLPGMVVFGFGLVALVAPVTATVLAAVDDRRAGVASGVNNAVARTAGLVAVAVLPVAAGIGPDAFDDPALLAAGFRRAMVITAALAVGGAAMAWWGLPPTLRVRRRDPGQPETHEHLHCPIDGPPSARQVPAGSAR